MLVEYENYHHMGMNISEIARQGKYIVINKGKRKKLDEAYDQLDGYLKSKNKDRGYQHGKANRRF